MLINWLNPWHGFMGLICMDICIISMMVLVRHPEPGFRDRAAEARIHRGCSRRSKWRQQGFHISSMASRITTAWFSVSLFAP